MKHSDERLEEAEEQQITFLRFRETKTRGGLGGTRSLGSVDSTNSKLQPW